MSAPGLLDQAIAAFALHAVWQVPLLAGAAWMAVRVGQPKASVAYGLWVATLLLCVAAPLVSTWQGYRAARAQAQASTASISYSTDDAEQNLPAMQREPAWLRMLHKHFNSVDGVRPFAFALPPRVAFGITGAYVLLLVFACIRFCIAWRRARNLVRVASADVPQPFVQAMQVQCEAMECRVPHVATSDEVAGPLLAGVMQPTLLLPANSAEDMSDEEVEAVLAHELSHLRRRDPFWHAVCSVILLPVQFHPVATWVAGRIRQTREMACDAEAVAWVGSSSRYADALLCVAERMSFSAVVSAGVGLGLFDVEHVYAAAVRDGRSWSKPGSATAGLEFFDATGAMEERMQSMMKHDETRSVRSCWMRGLAAATIAASGAAAACMIQVQPTFAAQQAGIAQPLTDVQREQQPLQVITEGHAPALISGRSAQKQLRDASRKLHEAEANATTEDDRKKIATAQQMLRMAQSELAEQSGPQTMTVHVMPPQTLKKLDRLDLQFKQLDDHVLRIKLNDQQVHLGALQAGQQRKILALQTQLNSTELQARVQQHAVDQIRVQVDAHIQDQVKEAQRIAKDSVMIAKLEPPMIFVEPQETPKTARVSAGVMAGQVVTKTVPVYPQSAKDAKISGSVVLHAIIDETGKVEQLAVVSSPDKELSKSAIDAVQHWTYKPYLLNGRPTAVDTTITVNYSFGG
jgi:TonB family protein